MKNMSRKFAMMTDEERLRFEQEQGETAAGESNDEASDELELGDPRDQERGGRQFADPDEDARQADARDGQAALLDDRSHDEHVDAQRRGRTAKRPGRRSGQ